jgi:hypothetical protein
MASIKNNPKDVPFDDIDNLLRHFGCKCTQKRRGSSHYKYTHPAVSYVLEIPKDKPIKAVYAKRALMMIEDIKEVLDDE